MTSPLLPTPSVASSTAPADVHNLPTTYTNVFRASGSAEELILDFGLDPHRRTSEDGEAAVMLQRLVLTSGHAKRLSATSCRCTNRATAPFSQTRHHPRRHVDLRYDRERDADRQFFYPAPDQQEVPLIYPPNEVPSPIPADRKGKMAGYAITALFGPRTNVTAATAKLTDDKGKAVDGWLSTPEKPAIAGFPQRSLCFLPKAPLRPGTRYTVAFNAEVNDRPWRRTWRFTTLKDPDRYSGDLDEKLVARVNAARKAAGLKPVRLDAELSRGCQSHARYLALNSRRSAGRGMNVHRQDADLPGASPAGAKAAEKSVIALILDPQMCVDNWMATLYHRLPILAPNLERVGFGIARLNGHKWACVLDTGNGRTASSPVNRPPSKEMP